MDKLYTKAQIENFEGKLVAVASEEVEDRDGDVITINGWELKNFKRNPVILWYHNIRERSLPIGKAVNIGIKTINGSKKLVFEVEFEAITEFGRTVKEMFEQGFLNTFSVGFIPLEREKNQILKKELLEISAVPVPALPSAEVISRSADLGMNKKVVSAIMNEDDEMIEKLLKVDDSGKKELSGSSEADDESEKEEENKMVVPYAACEAAPESRAWDGAAARKRMQSWASGDSETIDFAKYKQGFCWFDSEKGDTAGAYKLPHHDVQGNDLITVWRGVAAAMASLLGARGGTQIPDADRKAVYNHLKKHYAQFEKEAPDFRLIEDQVLKGLDDEIDALVDDYSSRKLYKLLSKIRSEMKDTQKEVKRHKLDETLITKMLLNALSKSVDNYHLRKGVK